MLAWTPVALRISFDEISFTKFELRGTTGMTSITHEQKFDLFTPKEDLIIKLTQVCSFLSVIPSTQDALKKFLESNEFTGTATPCNSHQFYTLRYPGKPAFFLRDDGTMLNLSFDFVPNIENLTDLIKKIEYKISLPEDESQIKMGYASKVPTYVKAVEILKAKRLPLIENENLNKVIPPLPFNSDPAYIPKI